MFLAVGFTGFPCEEIGSIRGEEQWQVFTEGNKRVVAMVNRPNFSTRDASAFSTRPK